MTEEEALTKWCPQALNRVVTTQLDDGGANISVMGRLNNDGHLIGQIYCIASKCMWWRLESKEAMPASGYCGAGGKP